ncbi:MAG TPA: NAD(P)-dependent oxidoreductase [Defluviicoccus sp.]|nr:NAD(P)-dependent oxidoreductase [Defluviicoccus sp.]
MRVMVTGHRGYIGPHVVRHLKALGHEVVGLDTGLYRGCATGELDSVPTIVKDVRDAEKEDFAGVDAVIHLAGLSNDPLGEFDQQLTYDINTWGSVRVATKAKEAGVKRFVFASTCSVYGAQGDTMIDESAPTNPVSPYARSKLMAEGEISKIADDSFCPVYLRPGTAFGASPMLRFDLVLNNLVAWATATHRVHVKSDGTPWRPLVHCEDIARAFVAAVLAPRELVFNQPFNVGATDANYRIREVAEVVAKAVPGSTVEFANTPDPDKRSYRVSFKKLNSTLDAWKPAWNAAAGADQIYDTIQTMKLTAQDFEGARYNRLPHLKKLIKEGYLDESFRWIHQPESRV